MIGEEGKADVRNRFLVKALIIISSVVLVLALTVFISVNSHNPQILSCGDGSIYGTCSPDKPYYCDAGALSANASLCGCPKEFHRSENSCYNQYNTRPKNVTLSYNYEKSGHLVNMTVYGGLSDYFSSLPYTITYKEGEQPSRYDFEMQKLENSEQDVAIDSLVKWIQNAAPDSKVDQARIAVSMVQNIPWGGSNETVSFAGQNLQYSRYPYQVLYDMEGLCGEKSELLALILDKLGYGTALFYYGAENHEAAGIKCPLGKSLNGTGYCFVETSGPAIISDSDLVYADGTKLTSQPELINISSGISLPSNMKEYGDAKILAWFRSRPFLGPISRMFVNGISRKYGLAEAYNLD